MSEDNSKKHVFKKYRDNRRLYDETNESYATIDDIVTAVKEGDEVSVIAIRGRAKKEQEAEDITHAMLVEALHRHLSQNHTLTIEDLVNLMRGLRPKWTDTEH